MTSRSSGMHFIVRVCLHKFLIDKIRMLPEGITAVPHPAIYTKEDILVELLDILLQFRFLLISNFCDAGSQFFIGAGQCVNSR